MARCDNFGYTRYMRRRYAIIISAVIGVLLLVGAYFTLPQIFGSVVAPLSDEYRGYFLASASEYNVDSCLLAAIAKVESNMNARATSGAGAQGLMQIVGPTFNSIARMYGIDASKGRYDAQTSIRVGSAYIRYNIDHYGLNLRNIAVAYNAGGGRVKLKDSALPSETKYYIVKVKNAYELYASAHADFCTGPSVVGGPTVKGNGSGKFPTGGNSATPAPSFQDFATPTPKPNIKIEDFWKSFL